MERTVPSTASEEIELYLRTLYSSLRSTAEVRVRALEETHAGMGSLLHQGARAASPDAPALTYAWTRLPDVIWRIRSVILGQSIEVFARHGYDVASWQRVMARARRRTCFYDGHGTLACLIASRSDIDDLAPALAAFQIEWNKLHFLLGRHVSDAELDRAEIDADAFAELARALQLPVEDLARLKSIWTDGLAVTLKRIRGKRLDLGLRLLSGSLSEYRRATHAWWRGIAAASPDVFSRPVYFVSSNTHSLSNLLSGVAVDQRQRLLQALNGQGELQGLWESVQSLSSSGAEYNFLYYLLKKVQQSADGRWSAVDQQEAERRSGIIRIPSDHYFDVEAQVLHLNRIDWQTVDPRLVLPDVDGELLAQSDAVIINIDYPLGMAAYNILAKLGEQVADVRGVYIMGKSASLNSAVGDVIIPNVVHDEHSRNTYMFENAFSAEDLAPFLYEGTVLDNQKAVTVMGTFLQNHDYMDVFYREGYTDIEMEAGAYLSAVYEMYRPKATPYNEIVNLYGLPFEVGVLHYVSDTPLSKGKNLGAGTLSYAGMEPTYATGVAILRRIMRLEAERLRRTHRGRQSQAAPVS